MTIIPIEKLLKWILEEEKTGQIFGILKELFFVPVKSDPFRMRKYGQLLETPLGVAAGPHTQMTQNIITAWLTGSRYIELKTVQTLDEIEVTKPCIDMRDEGYNCEWSQELKLTESYDQYLNAWIIIHLLKHKFGWEDEFGCIFNMSVGYDMEGILKPNVQEFLAKMRNCKHEKEEKIERLTKIYQYIKNINIPDEISNNITLSTMHGCPPGEIMRIAKYLIGVKKLHTTIKFNPTLMNPNSLRYILKNDLGFDIIVPQSAFEHEIKYISCIDIISTLVKYAKENNLEFTAKLTNTLECVNIENVLPGKEKIIYMSGRALHLLSVFLAYVIRQDVKKDVNISFSGGVDYFNFPKLIACGIHPVTVCSDLLKPGGYTRQLQYLESLRESMIKCKSDNIEDYILKNDDRGDNNLRLSKKRNLNEYWYKLLTNEYYKKSSRQSDIIKTESELNYFDCIKAPCVFTCPGNQDIPEYMFFTSIKDYKKAFEVILKSNPFPSSTGMICDQICQMKCTRINYDNPLLIREIKRFISDNQKDETLLDVKLKNGLKVAIVGAGPSGLSAAYYLTLEGFEVIIYEARGFPGGMLEDVIPEFRLSEDFKKDIDRILNMGVKIYYDCQIELIQNDLSKSINGIGKPSQGKSANNKMENKDIIDLNFLMTNHDFVYIAIGAQKSKKLGIPGEESAGVIDALEFLSNVRKGMKFNLGKSTAIIGGGNTAIDAARTAYRLIDVSGEVVVIYRRTINEMPANKNEIKLLLEEGIKIFELTAPVKIEPKNRKFKYLTCSKMLLEGIDANGRPKPVKIEGSEFVLEFDTIITAIGQEIEPEFVKNLTVNPFTNETGLKNVYIGGDALRGASTLIRAIADGKRAAFGIIEKTKCSSDIQNKNSHNYSDNEFGCSEFGNIKFKNLTFSEHQKKTAKRIFGQNIPELGIKDRKNFDIVTLPLNEESAVSEANRCLYCDEICNVCVSVCPNRANICYLVEPIGYKVPHIVNKDNDLHFDIVNTFRVEQRFQIINIANFCNECGNCTTFCPTNGSPFRDKPRFYLDEESFSKAKNGYYLCKNSENYLIKVKRDGIIETLTEHLDYCIYETENIIIKLDKKNFEIKEVESKSKEFMEIDLRNAAILLTLLLSLQKLYLFK